MNFLVWSAYNPGSGFAAVEEISNLTDEQESAVFFGKPLAQPFPTVRIKKLSEGELPDALGTFTASRLVSEKLREVLERACPEGIQFIPSKVRGARKNRYFLANITLLLACFDRDRSQYESFEDPPYAIRAVKKMVLKPVLPDTPAIFHLAEIPAVILVRDDLRDEMQSVSPSPGSFTPVDEFTFGVW